MSTQAAVAAACGIAGIAAFQIAIAAGAPVGQASWGGRHAGTLPTRFRVASAVAVPVMVVCALIVLRCAGLGPLAVPDGVARVGTWVLFGAILLSSLANFASPSRWERYFWGPYALVLAGLCFVVAHQ